MSRSRRREGNLFFNASDVPTPISLSPSSTNNTKSKEIDTQDSDFICISVEMVGSIGSIGVVTMNFGVSTDGVNFDDDTHPFSSVSLTLNGNSLVRKTIKISLDCIKKIRVNTTVNGDAIAGGVSGVQGYYRMESILRAGG